MRVGVVSTVPCTSSVAAVCRSELLSAVLFSRMAGAWPMVARVIVQSIFSSPTRLDIGILQRAAAEVAQKGRGEVV